MPGNDNVIDRLAIEVVGQATSALSDLDTLIDKFSRLKTDISKLPKITGDNFITKAAATNLNDFSTALSKVSMAYLGRFASALTSLATVDTTGLKEVASATKQLTAIGKISEIDHKPLLRLLSALNDTDLSGVANLSEAAKGLRAFNAVATMSKPGSGGNLGQAFATLESVDLGKIHALAEASSGLSSSFTSIASMSRSADASKLFGSFYVLENVNADKIKALSEASVGLSANFSSIASVSKSGSAEKLQGVFSAIEGANPEKIREIVDASNGLSSNFSSISSMSRNAGDGLKTAFSALQDVDTDKIKQLGAASKSLSNFSSIASMLRSGAKGVEETFAALGNEENFAILQKLSQIDFSNMRDLADASRVISRLRDRVKELEKTEDKTAQTQEKLARSTVKVTRESRKASSSFNFSNTVLGKLFNSIKRIAFYRAIRSALRAITQGFGEGIQNLYYWSQAWGTSFAPKMDQLATAQQYLKNGFASMFSPLIEYAIPIIDRLIDKLVDLFNFVQEGFARLTGAETWNKAIKQPVKYAEALDDASGSAKELKHQLLGFDELNVLNTPTASSRGRAGDEKDYSSMFELMKTATGSPFGKFGKFFEDIYGKVEKVLGIVKSFADFLKTLNFNPLGTSLSNLWNETLSPIIDDLLGDADWFREKVLQPITKFLVEDGIPAAIDLISAAISALWSAFKPLKDGLKQFWDQNGEWIMKMVSDAVMQALDKLKNGFNSIAEWFDEHGELIADIFADLAEIGEYLGPVFQYIAKNIGTSAWDTFTSTLNNTLDALEPALEVLSGILDILSVFGSGDGKAVEKGIKKIGKAVLEGLFTPIKVVIRALADVMDNLSLVFPALADGAKALRIFIGDEVAEVTGDISNAGVTIRKEADKTWKAVDEKTGEYVSITGARISSAQLAINRETANGISQVLKWGSEGARSSQQVQQWLEYCRVNGVDPLTGDIIWATEETIGLGKAGQSAAQMNTIAWTSSTGQIAQAFSDLPTANQNAINRIKEQTAALGQYIKNTLGVDVANYAPSAGYTIGSNLKTGIENGMRNVHLNIPATVNITNVTGSTASMRVHGATFDMSGFASGGFPSMASLFWAGENGIPEMLGTVGGRTAVAGGAEITGIREAILQQGDQQSTLLRQLVSAVNNKDLSLVANSSTGRWVSKALKAYSGVTG